MTDRATTTARFRILHPRSIACIVASFHLCGPLPHSVEGFVPVDCDGPILSERQKRHIPEITQFSGEGRR